MSTPSDTPSFEAALEELEATVRRLEGEAVSLDDALLLFERGIALSRVCTRRLDDAEQRVLILIEGRDGEAQLAPFDAPEP